MQRAFTWVFVAYGVAGIAAVVTAVAIDVAHPIGVALAADVVATAAVFAFSVAFRNSSFYDPYWSVAPIAIALYWAAGASDAVPFARQFAVMALVVAWSARLTHNWQRGWGGLDHQDWRYADIQARTGALYWPVSFLGIHLMPTLWVFAGCLSLYPALAVGARPFGWLDAGAVLVTGGAIWLEATADAQLRRFRTSAPAPGSLLATGLWARSRHPNYLGEMAFWWGLWLFGLSADPGWWWTIAGPLSITLMFRFVSLPMIETRMLERRPGWAEHVRRVPLVLPRLGPGRSPH